MNDPNRGMYSMEEVHLPGRWVDFVHVMHSGEIFEVDCGLWYSWLEVLPPAWLNRKLTLPDGQVVNTFGYCEGYDRVVAFWQKDDRYFGMQTNIMNPNP